MESEAILEKTCSLILAFFWRSITSAGQIAVIKAGRLSDSDSGKVLTDQAIVIRNNKFDTVGRNLSVPPNATVIDLSKMTGLTFSS